MKSAQKNILFLAVFHVMVLMFPLSAKFLHHHTSESHHSEHYHSPSLSTNSEHCFVCEFEYLPFEKIEIFHDRKILFVSFEFNAYSVNSPYFDLYHFHSLRAPPVAYLGIS